MTIYRNYIKRIIDIVCALMALIVFSWLYLILFFLVRVKLGSPVIFKQPRPGMKDKNGREKIFTLYKFRTMTDERDHEGNLLPDSVRLTPFGKKLRDWSLDELPEALNILKGDMSVVGPRPQLVRDMVFMTDEQRHRHDVRPGLSGLAQISGRNAISWDGKLAIDLVYIEKISLIEDTKIVFMTIKKVFMHEGINAEGQATVDDFGDALLKEKRITFEEYKQKQVIAKEILKESGF